MSPLQNSHQLIFRDEHLLVTTRHKRTTKVTELKSREVWCNALRQHASKQHVSNRRFGNVLARMHFISSFLRVSVYEVLLNHESRIENVLFFVFQSVSRASTTNMNSPPAAMADLQL
jgi:hypothetical protein